MTARPPDATAETTEARDAPSIMSDDPDSDPDPSYSDPSDVAIAVRAASRRWRAGLPAAQAILERAARAAVAAALNKPMRSLEISFLLGDDARIRRLNRDYRGQDRPTNVLAFPAKDDAPGPSAPGEPRLLGDVALAFETVQREAAEQGKGLADHVSHLAVHGVLHLLGHDHETRAEAARMERLEIAILARLGVPDPYARAPRARAPVS